MSTDKILNQLDAELEIYPSMGDHRLYKFLFAIIGHEKKTIDFMINELGYKKYEANRIPYQIEYRKKRYQQSKINSS